MHCFNSITVQLRHSDDTLFADQFGSFNSITVQLRHDKKGAPVTESLFQFHNGTIKTLSSTLATCMKARFNSITVQLRRMYTDNNTSEMEVSIP